MFNCHKVCSALFVMKSFSLWVVLESTIDLCDDNVGVMLVLSIFVNFVHEQFLYGVELLGDPGSFLLLSQFLIASGKGGGDDVLYLRLIADGQRQQMEVVHDKSQVVSRHDLGLHLPPFAKGVAHDGDQHVQEVGNDQEGRHKVHDVKHLGLRLVSPVEPIGPRISQEGLDHVPQGGSEAVVRNLVYFVVRKVIKCDLALGNQVVALCEHENVPSGHNHEPFDVDHDLDDDVDQRRNRVN